MNDLSGILPELVIPYGTVTECLAKLLKDDKDISILVLASGAGKEGPGPLVAMFTGAVQAIPVTIVPGTFTEAQIDAWLRRYHGKILVAVAVGIVFVVLCLGLYTLFRGGVVAASWSNKLMRIRIAAQAVAIVIILAVLYFGQKH